MLVDITTDYISRDQYNSIPHTTTADLPAYSHMGNIAWPWLAGIRGGVGGGGYQQGLIVDT